MVSDSAFTLYLFIALFVSIPSACAFDSFDPDGNITVKWDVLSWTGDRYVASVTIYNEQQYRHIEPPGWTLGWHWAHDEVIWDMQGAQARMQGDCSRIKNVHVLPHSCEHNPVVIDLMPGASYSLQTANCCRGGVLSSYAQDPGNAVASFQMAVGHANGDIKTLKSPRKFTFGRPDPGYTCSEPRRVNASLFPSPDGRRRAQALTTLKLSCMYTQHLAHRTPTCCVSFSSFYNPNIVPCPKCACDCSTSRLHAQPFGSTAPMCIDSYVQLREDIRLARPAANASSGSSRQAEDGSPYYGLYCSEDMCPIKVHWHVKTNYKGYWRAKVTITNRHLKNYTEWNLVVQHPNFKSLIEVFSFNSKPLTPYGDMNDTSLFWGIEHYNDMLLQAGQAGTVQSEMLFEKGSSFTFSQGWAFPHRVLFNGDQCVLPPPDSYPILPNGATLLHRRSTSACALGYVIALMVMLSQWQF